MENELKVPLNITVRGCGATSTSASAGMTMQHNMESSADGSSGSVVQHTFLAFGEVSTHVDQLRKKKKSVGTSSTSSSSAAATSSMIICAPYFLHGKLSASEHHLHTSSLSNHPSKSFLSSIDLVATYVYNLVDKYLELGTLKSNGSWNPRGWLLAKVQLPCCLSMSAMELLGMKSSSSGQYGLELDMEDGEDATYDTAAFHKRWKLLFTDETKSKATIVQSLVEFGNNLIISISVSCAILKHSHLHFQKEEVQLSSSSSSTNNNNGANNEASAMSVPATEEDKKKLQRRKRKQLEALRKLLQFQVDKIHLMQRICQNIHFALDGLYTEVCKVNSIARTQYKRVVRSLPRKEEEVANRGQQGTSEDDMQPPNQSRGEEVAPQIASHDVREEKVCSPSSISNIIPVLP